MGKHGLLNARTGKASEREWCSQAHKGKLCRTDPTLIGTHGSCRYVGRHRATGWLFI